jgi:hypothetical protein
MLFWENEWQMATTPFFTWWTPEPLKPQLALWKRSEIIHWQCDQWGAFLSRFQPWFGICSRSGSSALSAEIRPRSDGGEGKGRETKKTYSFSFLILSSSCRFFNAAIACWFNKIFLFFSAFSSLIFSSSALIASSSSSSPSGWPVVGCTPRASNCSFNLFASWVSLRRSANAREAIKEVMWMTCFVRTEFGFKRFRASIWRWISSYYVSCHRLRTS